MNQKELGELRRRFKPERSAVSRIYGCYVNSQKEVISYLDESLGLMPQEEAEKYLSLLKKALSGTQGRNLIDIVFTTEQVADSDEHRLLSALRESELKDGEVRGALYEKIMGSLDLGEGNYLILLAFDAYDVPYRGRDGENQADGGDSVFRYIICAICPVKEGKPELGYFPGENEFHNCTAGQIVSAPEAGFLFPAFDDRAANLYNALYYVRKPDELHPELIDALFRTEAPMSAGEQREAFASALTESLEESCSLEVVQSVHGRLRERIEEHRESRDPEPLAITAGEVAGILADCGVEEERVAAFGQACQERFGGGALDPANLIDSKKFEVKTGEVTISVDPEYSYLVETRVIDGRKYILIPTGDGVELNGLAVGLGEPSAEAAE
ncbi:MAG: DUF4317 domain-containing protein [Oscillospiraceae bacterium]|nr:DUF4317 domain-containing protein [Oscillospiraceae bacterium]